MTLRTKLAFAAALLLAPAPALAHHGWSGQDNTKVTTLEGKVQAVRFRDPHAEIDLTDNGQQWTVTLAPIERMEARGVTPAVLKVGSTVRIAGHRNLDMKKFEVKANEITVDGKTTGLR
jgi:hypothetical protein